MNKRLKRLFSFCMANLCLMNMLPVTGLAADKNETDESNDRSSFVFTEDDGTVLQRDVFDKIYSLENKLCYDERGLGSMTADYYVSIIPKVKKAIKNSKTYVSGTLHENGDFLTWETTLGVTCCYSPVMEEKLNYTLDDPTPAQIAEAQAKADDISSALHAYKSGYPTSSKIGLIQPFWNSSKSEDYYDPKFCLFSPSYKEAWEELCEVADSEGVRFTLDDATVDNIADTMEECGFVMFDSHGDTDYYDKENDDSTSKANTSFLVITSAEGLTKNDFAKRQGEFGDYANAMYGSGYVFINGACIADHMDKNAPDSLLYMAQCLGMATDGMFSGLQQKGVEAFWGYSQAVTFAGETAYMATITDELAKNANFSEATAKAKSIYGNWDYMGSDLTEEEAVANHIAFPVAVSPQDEYPGHGNVDRVLPVNSTWSLFKQYTVAAVSSDESCGTVSVDGKTITAKPAEGYCASGYTVVSGSAEVKQDGLVFEVDPSSDCTVQIDFTPVAPAVITYVSDGKAYSIANVQTGDTITLPSTAPVIDGWTALGWSETPFSVRTADKPDFRASGSSYYVTGNTSIHVVYAKYDETAANCFKKLESLDDLEVGRYVITTSSNAADMEVLTGLNNGEAYSKDTGFVSFADSNIAKKGKLLKSVPDNCIFDFTFTGYSIQLKNIGTNTYLGYSGSELISSSDASIDNTNWGIATIPPASVIFASQLTESYLDYSEENGFYMSDQVYELNLLTLWKESSPVIYTTSPSQYSTVILKSANVSLDSGLIMNYRFFIPEIASENGVKAVINGPAGEKTVELVKENGEYKASYPVKAIYADQDITVKLIDDSGAVIPFEIATSASTSYDSLTYGIYDYFRDALSSGLLSAEQTKQIKSAYTYCAYAVKWKTGKALPGSNINALPSVKADDLADHVLTIQNKSDKIDIAAISLLLDSNTAFRIYFTCSDDIKNHTITIDGNAADVTVSGKKYCVTLKDIYAGSLQTRHTLTIDNMTVSFDTLSYVYSALKSNAVAPELTDVVKAFYAYSECFKKA